MAKKLLAVEDEPPALPPRRPVSPPPLVSDEGVRYGALSTAVIINLSTDVVDRHRVRLHVHGRMFAHVAEDTDGRWLYRAD